MGINRRSHSSEILTGSTDLIGICLALFVAVMLKNLITFGMGVYVGIYLDQNRDIAPLSSPKELMNRIVNEVDRFLTGENPGQQSLSKKVEDDFFKGFDDFFFPSRKHQ
ncbi:unnamed protein product [Thelazia callipaeda]|uniref:Reticulon-like protein n=1 Tax=Thelazia callipaeda TaxID=103827 RepID=A0A0N5D1L5_THECL|nr:unnamed protein product [Thelazia callipaeda]